MTTHDSYYDFLIYASNVTGLGASQVAFSLVEALINNIGPKKTALIIPENSNWASSIPSQSNLRVIKYRRRLPHRMSRFLEVFFPKAKDLKAINIINLGDLPLRINGNQVVLVHQPHLVSPRITEDSSNHVSFRLMRMIMRINGHRVRKIIVQSDIFKRQLADTYPALREKIEVIPQPAPKWLYEKRAGNKKAGKGKHKLTLFYPAAGYPHKNHDIIQKMAGTQIFHERVDKIITTRSSHSWIDEKAKPYIDNRGRLSPSEMLNTYKESDALFFPSLSETYGLPLLEAMILGLPVICSDRPYARWMCGANADFFNPLIADSALAAIKSAHSKLKRNHRPDWESALSKIPDCWNQVALRFLQCF